jgi:hypothetical protein
LETAALPVSYTLPDETMSKAKVFAGLSILAFRCRPSLVRPVD